MQAAICDAMSNAEAVGCLQSEQLRRTARCTHLRLHTPLPPPWGGWRVAEKRRCIGGRGVDICHTLANHTRNKAAGMCRQPVRRGATGQMRHSTKKCGGYI